MIRFVIGLLLLPLISCTNIDLDAVNTRFKDNISGKLLSPPDIDPPGTDNFTFAVMGDSHVGSSRGKYLAPALETFQTASDSFYIILGDLTNNGKDKEYSLFESTISAVSIPLRAVVGNHDIFFNGWSRFREKFGRSMYSFNADNVHFTVLDTANGVLGDDQINWLKADLAATTRPLKVVLSHFPPWAGSFSSIFKMSSEEEAAILKDLMYKYSVNYMFAGHYHNFKNVKIGNTIYVVTGGLNNLLDAGRRHYVRVRVSGNTMSTEKINF